TTQRGDDGEQQNVARPSLIGRRLRPEITLNVGDHRGAFREKAFPTENEWSPKQGIDWHYGTLQPV
ncbi:MAG: hypothetical protein ACPLRM_02355, partial [Anaerolineae bacterium]